MKKSICVFLLVMLLWSAVSKALLITTTYGSTFSDLEKSCIADAVKEWSDLLPCSDGFSIAISFACDNSLSSLGLTSDWNFNAQGRPTAATVTIKNNAHNWTLGAPAAGQDDALDTLKHEVGHAIGFTVNSSAFAAHVITVSGNRFYDLDHDGVFNGSDLDLVDSGGTHTLTGLMAPSTPKGVRNHPTVQLANVLHDAFGYCVPEPATICLLMSGGLLLLSRRR